MYLNYDENELKENISSLEQFHEIEYMYSPNKYIESLGSIELNNGEKKDLHNDSLNYNIEDLINYKENIIDQNEYKYNYQIIKDLMRMKNNWDNDEEDDE